MQRDPIGFFPSAAAVVVLMAGTGCEMPGAETHGDELLFEQSRPVMAPPAPPAPPIACTASISEQRRTMTIRQDDTWPIVDPLAAQQARRAATQAGEAAVRAGVTVTCPAHSPNCLRDLGRQPESRSVPYAWSYTFQDAGRTLSGAVTGQIWFELRWGTCKPPAPISDQ